MSRHPLVTAIITLSLVTSMGVALGETSDDDPRTPVQPSIETPEAYHLSNGTDVTLERIDPRVLAYVAALLQAPNTTGNVTPQAACAPSDGCLVDDVPFVVDEQGDWMVGELRMAANVVMTPTVGLDGNPTNRLLFEGGTEGLVQDGAALRVLDGGSLVLEDGAIFEVPGGLDLVFDGSSSIGTSTPDTLSLVVNGTTGLRIVPGTVPSLLGGSLDNAIGAGVQGTTIGGGGEAGAPNRIFADFGTIGGGLANTIGDPGALSSAGSAPTAHASDCDTVGCSVIAGGRGNTITGDAGFIGGGSGNAVHGDHGVVTGGLNNEASGDHAAITGGLENDALGDSSLVGGGSFNRAAGLQSTVAGGTSNLVTSARGFIGGGFDNDVTGVSGVVSGGANNAASGFGSTVAGGFDNEATADFASVSGGTTNVASGRDSSIAGGRASTALGEGAHVGGGRSNLASGDRSGILAGENNVASGEASAAVGGLNNAAMGDEATVIGGHDNDATGVYSVVVGGTGNEASGIWSATLGGRANVASGQYSLALGEEANALHSETFVWSDGSGTSPLTTTRAGTFLVRAQGGVGIGTADPQTQLDVAGTVRATNFVGDGSTLSNVRADAIADGAVTGRSIGALCDDGQVLKKFSAGWFCGDDFGTGGPALSCGTDQILRSVGGEWTCSTDRDTSYTAGSGVVIDGDTIALPPCDNGLILKVVLADWTCTADEIGDGTGIEWSSITNKPAGFSDDVDDVGITTEIDPTVNAIGKMDLTSCTDGQIAKLASGTWTCAEDADTDTDTTYAAGDGLSMVGTTFSVSPCADGQVLKFDAVASGWTCAADATGETSTLPWSSITDKPTGFADNIDDVGITSETDPTVNGLAKTDLSACTDGQVAKLTSGAWTCGEDIDTDTDTDTTYDAGDGLVLDGTTFALPSCTDGLLLKRASSSWTCSEDLTGAGGTVSWTNIIDKPAGFADDTDDGIIIEQDPTVNALAQSDLEPCTAGQVPKWNGQWKCGDDVDTDTDTTYTAGDGLALSGDTFSADTSVLQARITSSCPAGSSIRAVAADGSVTCETDDDTDTDTLASLACAEGELAKVASGAWTCGTDASIGQLDCTEDQIVRQGGFTWHCSTDRIDGGNAWSLGGIPSAGYLRADAADTFDGTSLTIASGSTLALEGVTRVGAATSDATDDMLSFNGGGERFGWDASRASFGLSDNLVVGQTNGFGDGRLQADSGTQSYLFLEASSDLRSVIDRNNDESNAQFRWYANGASNVVMRLTEAGQLSIDGNLVTGGADLAEAYVASEPVRPGELVRLDPARPGAVLRTTGASDVGVLGVVSTEPGLVLTSHGITSVEELAERAGADVHARFLEQLPALEHAVLAEYDGERPLDDAALEERAVQLFLEESHADVALSGRVPVLVSEENGPVLPGDRLAPASTPGMAMRAGPDATTTVGIALEASSTDSDTVLTFVDLQHRQDDRAMTDVLAALQADNDALRAQLADLQATVDQLVEERDNQ